jgi:hypothetical protein
MTTQLDSLIEQLQAKLVLVENTTIDVTSFKAQKFEINEKLEAIQQDLYQKVDTIQKHYQSINNSLKNIYEKQKDSCVARSKFQEFIIWRQKSNISVLTPFSQYEQVKGEMAFNVWGNKYGRKKETFQRGKGGLSRDIIFCK